MISANQLKKSTAMCMAPYIAVGVLALAFSAILNPVNHYLSALLLVLCAVLSYFYIVQFTTKKNWLDIRAVFSFVWLFTVGLSSLRLLEYQEHWQKMTWLLLALTYGILPVGIILGETLGKQLSHAITRKSIKNVRLSMSCSGNHLFWICIVVTAIGMGTFAIGVAIKGMIPLFSSDPNAYVMFYTRFHVFSVASTSISGLSYYCLKTQPVARWRRILLYVSILYSTFLFPILVVSRGTFLTSAVMLTTAVFYLNGKRFWVLLTCIVFMGGVYALSSMARGYSDRQLDRFFEPTTIYTVEEQTETYTVEEQTETQSLESFTLPSKIAFLYSYLTVSHDNFNEAVENSTRLSYGIRQFRPFNVILRLPLPEIEKTYLVRDHLNTYNLIGDAYYDFHEIGVIVSVFIWGFLFGAIQAWYLTGKGPFALLALGNSVSAVALSFFAPWMSEFTHWMFWGVALLLFLVCCVRAAPKQIVQK